MTHSSVSAPRRGSLLPRGALLVVTLLLGLMLAGADAEAKRLGGGGSFGRQSSQVAQRRAQPPAPAPSNTSAQPARPPAPQPVPAPIQPPARNSWLGPLAGIAAGVGLAALFSHFGMGGAMGGMFGSLFTLLLVGFGIALLWRLLRGAMAPAQPRPAYATPVPMPMEAAPVPAPAAAAAPLVSVAAATASGQPAAPWGLPADFDRAGFERSAKVNFIRLQAAWDARDLADIREFTTPEMYAELKLQLDEDRTVGNRTEVETVEAEVLGIEETTRDLLASVRFSGRIRENPNAPAEPFQEVWNLSKPLDGRTGWLLAGIQQLQ